MKKTDTITIELTAYDALTILEQLGTDSKQSIIKRLDGVSLTIVSDSELLSNYYSAYENLQTQIERKLGCSTCNFRKWEPENNYIDTTGKAIEYFSREENKSLIVSYSGYANEATGWRYDEEPCQYKLLTVDDGMIKWIPLTEVEYTDE